MWWTLLIYGLIFIVTLIIIPNLIFSWTRMSRPVVEWNQLKTGDILYTSAPGPSSYLFSLAGIQGGHAMLIVRDDDTEEVKILEISGYRDNPEGQAQPCIRPLYKRFESGYDLFGSVYRYNGPHISSRLIDDFLDQVKDYKFNYQFVGEHVKYRFTGKKRSLNKERLCCSELTYMGLVYVGIIQFNEDDWSDSFRYLMGVPGYSEPHDLALPTST